MGAVNSVQDATDEANNVMQMIDRKCNSYVMSVEHTNSVVDITLAGLRKEIFALIEPLRDSKSLVDLGMEDMAAVLHGVEHHANIQKFVIQRLLDIVFEAQSTFEEMTDSTMANADVDDIPDVLLDEGVMTDMRIVIESLLSEYEGELRAKDVAGGVVTQRCDELHRLLFKLAEVTVSEMVDATVADMKGVFLEDIDSMIAMGMVGGHFKDTLAAKACLQNVISKSVIARVSLEALPFSRRVEVEAGQEEIESFVDDLVRKVQLHHSNEQTPHFDQLMNLGLDYEDSGESCISSDSEEGVDDQEENNEDDYSSSSDDDNSTEPENSDGDEDTDGTDERDEVIEVSDNVLPNTRGRRALQKGVAPSPAAGTEMTPAKASLRPRKRKSIATPVDDEVSMTVMEKRATRSRRL